MISLKTSLKTYLIFQVLLLAVSAQLQFPSSFIKFPNNSLTFYFEYIEKSHKVRMGLEIAQPVDYFAIGFGNETSYQMRNFDIVSFVFTSDSKGNKQVKVMDHYSAKNGFPPEDNSLGGTNDYTLIDSYTSEEKYQVLFERAWDTKDKFDIPLNPEKTKNNIILNWAWARSQTPSISFHKQNAGTVISPMYNGFQGVAVDYSPNAQKETSLIDFLLSKPTIMTIHKYGMLFVWGFLIEVVIQIGRYQKHKKQSINIHGLLGFIIYSSTLFSFIFTLYIKWGQNRRLISEVHFYLGILTFILVNLQVIFGALLSMQIRGNKQTLTIPSLTRGHLIGGISLYFITKVEVALGLIMFRPDYQYLLYAYFGALLIFRVIQENAYRAKRRMNGKNTDLIEGESQNESHQKLMSLLNDNVPASEITAMHDLRFLKWTVLDDKVFEVKDFYHPGGNFILEQTIGKEIGRFIYGAYGLFIPQQPTQHAHSNQIFEVIKRNYIGTIQNGHDLFHLKEGEESFTQPARLEGKRLISSSQEDVDWVLDSSSQISPLVTKFEFKCRKFYINPSIKDIRHLGRHIKISHASNSKVRLYTLVLSQTEFRKKRREYLWNKFTRKSASPTVDQSNDTPSDTLPLIVKNYEVSSGPTFSNFLHQSLIGLNGFYIEGPYGNGLELTPASTGVHYIFTAGTGIYPFIDLFDFLLNAMLDTTSDQPNILEKGFKLHVFASFMQVEDFVGLDICEKLIHVCQKKNLNDVFKLTIKTKNGNSDSSYELTQSKFNFSFIEKNIDRNCQKVYVCGPPEFNEDIPNDLKAVGIPQNKILVI